jgi:uncharacterized protein YdaU (DUF1376 family)
MDQRLSLCVLSRISIHLDGLMKPPPAFQFYAGDYLSSSRVQAMSLEAEGAYIRLLCYQWQDGSIPDDLRKLARLCKISERKMKSIWVQVSPCFDLQIESGRLANARLEEIRKTHIEFCLQRSASGRLGGKRSGEVRSKREAHGSNVLKQTGKQNEALLSSSSSSSSSPVDNSNPVDNSPTPKAAAAKRAARDAAMDAFTAAYETQTGAAYVITDADGAQLARMRRANNVPARASPEDWPVALGNYFATPLSAWTLKDLATRYGVFRNSRLDRYGRPVNHQNAGGQIAKSKTDRNLEAAERLRARWSAEDSSSSLGGDL